MIFPNFVKFFCDFLIFVQISPWSFHWASDFSLNLTQHGAAYFTNISAKRYNFQTIEDYQQVVLILTGNKFQNTNDTVSLILYHKDAQDVDCRKKKIILQ